jgi:hypothetical protein
VEPMKCGICGEDIGDIIVSLPIKTKDGRFNTLACLKCAEKSSAYCKKHQKPHLGFFDGTTACIDCIEEMIVENQEEYSDVLFKLKEVLPKEEFDRLVEWAIVVGEITGNSRLTCVLRAVVTKAKRSNQGIEEVIQKITEDKSVESILPSEVFP